MTNKEAIEILSCYYERGNDRQNTAMDMAIEALKHSEIPNSSDCISRKAAIDALARLEPTFKGSILEQAVRSLPSVQPDRKKGKWIWKTGDVYKCSECETETHVDECFEEPIYNYCPYCNVFMDGYER